MTKNRFEKKYGGNTVRVAVENGQVLFHLIDCAYAVGYSRTASLRHHTRGKNREVNLDSGIYLSAKSLGKVAKDTINQQMPAFANWAKKLTDEILSKAAKVVKKPAAAATTKFVSDAALAVSGNPTLYGIKDASKILGMTAQALSDWLVAEGYAGRYTSNNALFWKKWFRDQQYGTRPLITDEKGTRESNVAKLTQSGLEFVQSRIESQRDSNVLSFAIKASADRDKAEREKLEKEIDDLIVQTFKPYEARSHYSNLLGTSDTYEMHRHEVISSVKAIIAQVKLKEMSNAV